MEPRPPRPKPRRRGWWTAVVIALGAVALAACGTGTWFLASDTEAPAPAQHRAAEAARSDRLTTRHADPRPLTERELFGSRKLRAHASVYSVLGTQSLKDCGRASTGAVSKSLRHGHCTQVVRATVDTDGYVATAGVANLVDAAAATSLRSDIGRGKGGLTALHATGAGKELGLKPTVLGYNTYGHYLLYVVIGRTDHRTPLRDEPGVQTIVSDLVDTYLVQQLKPRDR